MNESNLPKILTPGEIADYLKVDLNLVRRELENGSLQGFKVGAEWRSTDIAVLNYVNREATIEGNSRLTNAEQSQVVEKSSFRKIDQFDFQWPLAKEHFQFGYETEKILGGRSYLFRIGFTDREAAGQLRRRIVVWKDNWPLVEFAAGNNFGLDGLLASVIKLGNGKQLRSSEKIPAEYGNFRTARYDSVVQGPYASHNMAIIVHKDDMESMLSHAIIRGKWKKLI